MDIYKELHIIDRREWRAWLEKNYDSEKEIWLIFYKKGSGKACPAYNDTVEEAICFGWIDSIVKKIDEEKYARKFTPRKDKSEWSELNISRVKKMIEQGKMTEAGFSVIDKSLLTGETKPKKHLPEDDKNIPPELYSELAKNKDALNNFNNFAPGYRKLYIRWIMSAKKEETRMKRIAEIVERSERNEKPGLK